MPLRLKAFLVHLGCSLAIALVTLGLVYGLWYPDHLHRALGVTSVFLLLLTVDVIIGPLLTLLVYKPGKKTLKFDLAVIVLLQLAALGYGLWTVAQGRPAWLVFNADRFDVVQVVDIDARRLEEAQSEYRSPSWLGPRWVAAVRPDDAERRGEILFETLQGGPDIAQRPEQYRPLDALAEQLRRRAQPLERLKQFNDPEEIEKRLAGRSEAAGWLPLKARVQPMVVLLSKDYRVLDIVPLKPWP